VVEVYDHGWLEKTESLYFIDMEYCSETLKGRIGSGVPKVAKHNDVKQVLTPPNESLEKNPKGISLSSPIESLEQKPKGISLSSPNESLEHKPKGISPSSNCSNEALDTPLPIPDTREDSGSVLEFDFESVAEIVEDIVSGLIYLHEHKTGHRDLKPGNSRFDISKLH